ncbi:peptidoglycan-binding protein [Plantactinospora sp. ZYX-F-223]|uniref:peptidoglycan-binding protein n=1 Tax=Plantactinospora sp. ZYX-F-223 TaxID=3144103 RepID=UPI0031FDB7F8
MRRLLLIGAVVLGTVLAGVAVATRAAESDPAPTVKNDATAPVLRTDLVDTKTVTGTVRFADQRTLTAVRAGTVTAVASAGTVVKAGHSLYSLDRMPTVLLRGSVPMYRTLAPGVPDGPDVAQLEAGLRALGHGAGLTVDRRFTAATARAVRAWQARLGVPATGSVGVERVVFLPQDVRVVAAAVTVGARVRPAAGLLTVGSTQRVVTIRVDVADQHLLGQGAEVTVRLPGGVDVPARIDEVGLVAAADGTADSADDGGTDVPATISAELGLDDQSKVQVPDQTPVVVALRSQTRAGVLSVPVEALLAMREGGYAVEVVQAGTARTVPVRVGMFAGGRVEITDSDLTEGAQVRVPAS